MKKIMGYVIGLVIVLNAAVSIIPNAMAGENEQQKPFNISENEDPGPILNDTLIADDISQYPYHHSPPGFRDTSEYMIGDISVGIILMESNGATDPSTEDWTTTEQYLVYNAIQDGCFWWTGKESDAHLTFQYDVHLQVPTSLEPISHASRGSSETTWVNEAMSSLGYTTDDTTRFQGVRNYINALRNQQGTDWAFAVFVIDSSEDYDGKFSDARYAYAYLGGPYIVMTYDNGAYGIENMAAVLSHEMGHIFYALDEYEGSSSATARSGYLNIINSNHIINGTTNDPCIMKETIEPYNSDLICVQTKQMLGWRDSDSDGLFDPVDVFPLTQMNTYGNTPRKTSSLIYTGGVEDNALQNNNPNPPVPGDVPGNDVSINTITNVEYRINGGSWFSATADDGAFDEYHEDFTFSTGVLDSDGPYTIEVRSMNSVGNIEMAPYTTDDIIIDTTPPVSNIVPSGGFWQVTSPFTLSAVASDANGISWVSFYYRFSNDNINWNSWSLIISDTVVPYQATIVWGSGQGYYQFYSIARDIASNVETAPASPDVIYGFDNVPPTTPFLYELDCGPNWGTHDSPRYSWTIPSDLSGIDHYVLYIDGIPYSTTANNYHLTLGSGIHTAQVMAVDILGNSGALSNVVTVKIDYTPPTVTQFYINNIGDTSTQSRSVTLTISATDSVSGVSSMRFCNENTYSSMWQTVVDLKESTHPVLPGVTQRRYVSQPGASQLKVHFEKIDTRNNIDYVYVKDANENIINTYTGFSTNFWSLPVPGDLAYIDIVCSGVDTFGSWGFRVDQFQYYSQQWSSWESYSTTKAWTLSTNTGLKTVYCQVRDYAYHIVETQDQISLTTLATSISINNGAGYTTSPTVSLNLDASPTTTQMRLTNSDSKCWQWVSNPAIDNTRALWWRDVVVSPILTTGGSYGPGAVDMNWYIDTVPASATKVKIRFDSIHLGTYLGINDVLTVKYFSGGIWRNGQSWTGHTTGPFYSNEIPRGTSSIRINLWASDWSPGDVGFTIGEYQWRDDNLYYPEGMDQTWTLTKAYATNLQIRFAALYLNYGDQVIVSSSGGTNIPITGPITLTNYVVQVAGDTMWVRMRTDYDGNRQWGIYIDEFDCYDYLWTSWMSWSSTVASWDITNPAYGGTSGDGTKTMCISVVDGSGNYGFNSDQIVLDTISPTPPTISSPTHPDPTQWYANCAPSFTWTSNPGTDSSGIPGYRYLMDQQPTTSPPSTTTMSQTSISYNNMPDGIWYLHICAVDSAGLVSTAAHYQIKIDASAPSVPVITSNIPTSVMTNVQPSFTWTIPSEISGISGYSYLLDNAPSTDSGTTVLTTQSQKTYTTVASGTWYFHVRAMNNAGLWGNTGHTGPFIIDSDLPTQPVVSSSTHTIGVWSLDPNPAFSWTASSDVTSGIDGYRYIFDHGSSTNPSGGTFTSGTSVSFPATADGVWYFHICVKDNAGNIGLPVHFGPIIIDQTPVSSHVCSFGSSTYNIITFYVIWQGDTYVSDITRYNVQYKEGVGGPWTDWYSGTALWQLFTGKNGQTYYFQSRAQDKSGYIEPYPGGDGDAHVTIAVTDFGAIDGHVYQEDTTIPVASTTVQLIIGAGGPAPEIRTTLTDAQGFYSFSNVAAGPVTVKAWSKINPTQFATVNAIVSIGITTHATNIYVPSRGTLFLASSLLYTDGTPATPPSGSIYKGTDFVIWNSAATRYYGTFRDKSTQPGYTQYVTASVPIGETYEIIANMYYRIGSFNGVYIGRSIVTMSADNTIHT
ncbi:MAG: hypothetical protein HZB92_01900, partial [Euryarchaeota archaeon]|nr:hypothetical protein [Euryarchaeota archaeon]